MGNVNARDRPYPGDDAEPIVERHQEQTRQVALDGIEANVKRVHVEGLVRTKEDVVSMLEMFIFNFVLGKKTLSADFLTF